LCEPIGREGAATSRNLAVRAFRQSLKNEISTQKARRREIFISFALCGLRETQILMNGEILFEETGARRRACGRLCCAA